MRAVLFEHINKAIAENENVFFLTAEAGFNLVEPMFEKFPDRAMNIGIAEANLVGVAAGLCNAGFKPICYSYTNFLAERAFEQIRDDICLHHYAPILVGTNTGFDNGALGPTHYVLDDMAGLRSLPNMRIYSPSSSESMGLVMKEALQSKEASFVRFTKSELSEGSVPKNINHFMIQREDNSLLVISHGKMAQNCQKAAALNEGFSLFAMDRIKPLDENVLRALLTEYKKVVVVEDCFRSAGLYNAICQSIIENDMRSDAKIVSLNVPEVYESRIGDPAYMDDHFGLSPEKIAAFMRGL
jgi:transketolase